MIAASRPLEAGARSASISLPKVGASWGWRVKAPERSGWASGRVWSREGGQLGMEGWEWLSVRVEVEGEGGEDAEVGHVGLEDVDADAGGDAGVDRVAAFLEDAGAGQAGEVVAAGDGVFSCLQERSCCRRGVVDHLGSPWV